MAPDDDASNATGGSSSKKRPRSPPPPPPAASRSAEALLSEAQALIEKEDPEDVGTTIALLEGCIAAAAEEEEEGTEEGKEEEEEVTDLAVVRSMAHTWLAKIREQQDEDEDDEGDGPADDLGGPALADALAHYEAALACWPENATAAYALAVRRSSRLTTEAGLAAYERLLRTAVEHTPEEDEETRRMAMEDLALLLLQRGDSAEADELLRGQLGFMHRLSTAVLGYTLETSLPATAALGPDARPFLRVFDDALAPPALAAMQEAFSPQSPFWKEHGYWRAEQGYFSYLCDLQGIVSTGCPAPRLAIEAVILQALFPLAVQAFPEVAQATTAEWWAHCRRHASAHQLHFDSLDEGRGYVQHPIASCILYLTGNGVGGPTLMTDQTLLGWGERDTGLATQGWFCHAKPNRVCVFDAKHLHGVVPGRGLPPADTDTDDHQRRITFMVGFWRTRVPPKPLAAGDQPGASMDLSSLLQGQPPPAWVAQGRRQLDGLSVGSSSLVGEGVKEACGGLEGPLPCVWEALVEESEMGREEFEREARPPRYDECFQGF